jgi:cobalt/nickel transport system permease protein
MHTIDRYAYSNRLRGVDPAHKAGLALLVIVLCLVLDEPAVGLLAAGWMWFLTVALAALPPLAVAGLLLAESTFLALACLGVALSLSGAAVPGSEWAWQVGPLWLSSSPAALNSVAHLLTRALGGATAMNFLALTTPLVDLVDLLRRLRVPALLIDLMTVIYRFIFVLLESLERMHTAQSSRLGYVTWRRGLASAGLLGSRLFLDAYERSRRLETALQSRGYDGQLNVLPTRYLNDKAILGWGVAVVVTLLAVWMAI